MTCDDLTLGMTQPLDSGGDVSQQSQRSFEDFFDGGNFPSIPYEKPPRNHGLVGDFPTSLGAFFWDTVRIPIGWMSH
jgi:hypothetical protein